MSPVIRRISTAEAVVHYFKDRISDGTLRAGDRLPSERELQETLEISRFSLREGLARLSALGIITVRHGAGAFVNDEVSADSLLDVLTPVMSNQGSRDFRDLVEARNVIETQVAGLAAKRANDKDIAQLREIVKRSGVAIDEPETFGHLDYTFHNRLAQAAHNGFLAKMLCALTDHLKSFLLEHARDSARRKRAGRAHRQILACIEKGDSEGASHAMGRHIVRCFKEFESDQHNRKEHV